MVQLSRERPRREGFLPDPATQSLSDPDRHLVALTGLRALAAGWVVLFHASLLFQLWVPLTAKALPITGMGFLGVDLFFALSGFVLCHRYLDSLGPRLTRINVRDFLFLRIARLYPVHIFVLLLFAVYVAILAGTGSQRGWDAKFPVSAIPQNIFLVHAWFNQQLSWNGPAWSVSMEWLAYLCFPLVALILYRVARSRIVVVWAGLFIVVVNVPLALHVAGVWTFPPNTFATLPAYSGFVSLNLVRLLAAFGGGCAAFVLARAWQRSRGDRSQPARWLIAIFLVSLLLVVVQFARSGSTEELPQTWLISPILVLLVAMVGLGGRGFSWLEHRRVVQLGLSSYSLYMTHWFVFCVFGVVPGIDIGVNLAEKFSIADQSLIVRSIFCLVAIATCYGAAHLCWRLVEEPSRRTLRRVLSTNAAQIPVEERFIPLAQTREHE
jgi:peptidoglycan/LPS O-acetylase OafA/YrhL